MTTPMRIQRRRTKGYTLPANTVNVTRPGPWGNPWKVELRPPDTVAVIDSQGLVVRYFKCPREAARCACNHVAKLLEYGLVYQRPVASLAGKNLACWCRLCEKHKSGKPLGVECEDCEPCHADVLLMYANKGESHAE